MAIYTRKSQFVEAVLWNGANTSAVKACVGKDVVVDRLVGEKLMVHNNGVSAVMSVGQYMVREGKTHYVMTESDFNDKYQKLKGVY